MVYSSHIHTPEESRTSQSFGYQKKKKSLILNIRRSLEVELAACSNFLGISLSLDLVRSEREELEKEVKISLFSKSVFVSTYLERKRCEKSSEFQDNGKGLIFRKDISSISEGE